MHGCPGSHEIVLVPLIQEALADFRSRMQSNFNNIIRTSVQDNTARTYCSGVRCWKGFVAKMQLPDEFLEIIPTWFIRQTWSYQSAMIGQFLTYLVSDNGVGFPTASGYVSAVQFFFKSNIKRIDMFSCTSLQDARKSLKLRHEQRVSSAESRRRPYSHAMLKCLETNVVSRFDPKGFCIIVAAHLAVTLILRCSEYIFSLEQHFIRGQDVLFELFNPRTNQKFVIASPDAYLHDDCQLCTTYIYLRDAKNDEEGQGNGYGFAPSPVSESNMFDIATEMFRCAVMCRPLHKIPFFSCTHGRSTFVLMYKEFNAALKRGAFHATGSALKIGSHSLRILGVAIQHAAQVSDVNIQVYMRSKSLSFLRYIRLSLSTVEGYRSAAANPSLYTDEDILMLNMAVSGVS